MTISCPLMKMTEIMADLKGKDFLTLLDISRRELLNLLNLSITFKELYESGIKKIDILSGKVIALLFQKPSTRTRISFEVAIRQLGGESLYLSWKELQLVRGETVADTARVLEKYVDAVVARVYKHQTLIELAKNAEIPIINALSDMYHPCQILADLMTLKEHFGELKGKKIGYIGDGFNNVTHSLIIGSAMSGINITIASPAGYEPSIDVINKAKNIALETGSKITLTDDPIKAVEGSDVIYTDVFVSMGKESEREVRLKVFKNYQVNWELFSKAPSHAVFMHCGPWHLGEEVTPEVVYSERSLVFEQAENRLHTEKALLASILS